MIQSNLLRSVLLVLGSVPILRGWEHVPWGSTGFDDMNDPINKLAFPVNSHAWWGMCFWAWQVDDFTTTGGLTGQIFLEKKYSGIPKWRCPKMGVPPNRPFLFGIFHFGVPALQETTKIIAMFATACRCPKFPHWDCMALVSMGVPCDKRLKTRKVSRPRGDWGIPRCENQYFWHLLKSMFQRDWCFHGFHGLANHQYPHIRCRLGYSNPSTPCFLFASQASSSSKFS